jgi:hypothetical protein
VLVLVLMRVLLRVLLSQGRGRLLGDARIYPRVDLPPYLVQERVDDRVAVVRPELAVNLRGRPDLVGSQG